MQRQRMLEYFILLNISFLAIDIYIAHSINAFAHWAEWIPFYFSVVTPLVLLIGWRGVQEELLCASVEPFPWEPMFLAAAPKRSPPVP